MESKPHTPTKKSGAQASPSYRASAYRLTQLRKKMSTLRQEEEKICRNLGQELSQCLIDAGALDVEFDILVGGMIEVIAEAKAEGITSCPEGKSEGKGHAPNGACSEQTRITCPERSRRIEGWRKTGLTFQQGRRQPPSSGKETQPFGTIAETGG